MRTLKPSVVVLAGLLTFLAWLMFENWKTQPTVTVHETPSSPVAETPQPPAVSEDLPAGAGCTATDVWVDNKASNPWTDTRIVVNGTYEYVPGAVLGGGRQPYMPHLFTKSDGSRLNLRTVTCRTIDIHATLNGRRAHWNGAYR